MPVSSPLPSLGVIFHPRFPPETLPDYARRAESAGFDELWLWDDCFLPGALTSAAIALSATHTLKVGIGLLPATAYNPLFAAMEITTLARAFPGRILPGFGHGVSRWMEQIGAAPKSTLRSLDETITNVRRLLGGEMVTTRGSQVKLDQVQMTLTPVVQPPLYVGAIREKSLRLAGRLGDGSILVSMSSPAYLRWAWGHIQAGMAESGRTQHNMAVYVDVKVHPEGKSARAAMRHLLAKRLPNMDVHLDTCGLREEAAALVKDRSPDEIARLIPDAWLDMLTACGTPDQAAASIQRLYEAGATTVIFEPMDGDPGCLEEYIRYLMPVLRSAKTP